MNRYGKKIAGGLKKLRRRFSELGTPKQVESLTNITLQNMTKAKKILKKIFNETSNNFPSRTLVSHDTMVAILHNISIKYPQFTTIPSLESGNAKTGFGAGTGW